MPDDNPPNEGTPTADPTDAISEREKLSERFRTEKCHPDPFSLRIGIEHLAMLKELAKIWGTSPSNFARIGLIGHVVDLRYPVITDSDQFSPLTETVHLIHQLVLTKDYARMLAILRAARRSDDPTKP